jgi:hypothetical protein
MWGTQICRKKIGCRVASGALRSLCSARLLLALTREGRRTVLRVPHGRCCVGGRGSMKFTRNCGEW